VTPSPPEVIFGDRKTAASSANASIRKFSDTIEEVVRTLTDCETLLNPEALARVEL
jgi:hypothetical protein